MNITYRDIWPTLFDLELWGEKNCYSCRFCMPIEREQDTAECCTVFSTAMRGIVKDRPVAKPTLYIVHGPHVEHMGVGSLKARPRCFTKKDRRGRPRNR